MKEQDYSWLRFYIGLAILFLSIVPLVNAVRWW